MNLIHTYSLPNFGSLAKQLLRTNNKLLVFGKYKQSESRPDVTQCEVSLASLKICFYKQER